MTPPPCSICGAVDGFVRHGDELLCSPCTAWVYNTKRGLPSRGEDAVDAHAATRSRVIR